MFAYIEIKKKTMHCPETLDLEDLGYFVTLSQTSDLLFSATFIIWVENFPLNANFFLPDVCQLRSRLFTFSQNFYFLP